MQNNENRINNKDGDSAPASQSDTAAKAREDSSDTSVSHVNVTTVPTFPPPVKTGTFLEAGTMTVKEIVPCSDIKKTGHIILTVSAENIVPPQDLNKVPPTIYFVLPQMHMRDIYPESVMSDPAKLNTHTMSEELILDGLFPCEAVVLDARPGLSYKHTKDVKNMMTLTTRERYIAAAKKNRDESEVLRTCEGFTVERNYVGFVCRDRKTHDALCVKLTDDTLGFVDIKNLNCVPALHSTVIVKINKQKAYTYVYEKVCKESHWSTQKIRCLNMTLVETLQATSLPVQDSTPGLFSPSELTLFKANKVNVGGYFQYLIDSLLCRIADSRYSKRGAVHIDGFVDAQESTALTGVGSAGLVELLEAVTPGFVPDSEKSIVKEFDRNMREAVVTVFKEAGLVSKMPVISNIVEIRYMIVRSTKDGNSSSPHIRVSPHFVDTINKDRLPQDKCYIALMPLVTHANPSHTLQVDVWKCPWSKLDPEDLAPAEPTTIILKHSEFLVMPCDAIHAERMVTAETVHWMVMLISAHKNGPPTAPHLHFHLRGNKVPISSACKSG